MPEVRVRGRVRGVRVRVGRGEGGAAGLAWPLALAWPGLATLAWPLAPGPGLALAPAWPGLAWPGPGLAWWPVVAGAPRRVGTKPAADVSDV